MTKPHVQRFEFNGPGPTRFLIDGEERSFTEGTYAEIEQDRNGTFVRVVAIGELDVRCDGCREIVDFPFVVARCTREVGGVVLCGKCQPPEGDQPS